jgi:hypothetical protein
MSGDRNARLASSLSTGELIGEVTNQVAGDAGLARALATEAATAAGGFEWTKEKMT